MPKVWEYKIGDLDDFDLPDGADFPLRQAVAEAYRKLTGREPLFNFTGWGAKLTEMEAYVAERKKR